MKKRALEICKYKKLWFSISFFLISLSLVSITGSVLKFKAPLKLGLDFIGGTQIVYEFKLPKNKSIKTEKIKELISKQGPDKDFRVQISRSSEKFLVILKLKVFEPEKRKNFEDSLEKEYGSFQVISADTISSIIGPEILSSGLTSIFVTLLGILLFVSFRFKKEFAFAGIIALIHDVFLVIGLFSFLGLFFNLEINTLFLTACLTVFGFSIHDTIVIFDRIRENMKYLSKKRDFEQIIDLSISQTWFRSLCTSLTTLFVLFCLLVFGGDSTKIFAGAMFIGILAGTYSSIFLASNLLISFVGLEQTKKRKKF